MVARGVSASISRVIEHQSHLITVRAPVLLPFLVVAVVVISLLVPVNPVFVVWPLDGFVLAGRVPQIAVAPLRRLHAQKLFETPAMGEILRP